VCILLRAYSINHTDYHYGVYGIQCDNKDDSKVLDVQLPTHQQKNQTLCFPIIAMLCYAMPCHANV